MDSEKRYYRPDEVAQMCRVSRRTVYRWIREKKLSIMKKPSGRILIEAEKMSHNVPKCHTISRRS